MLTLGWWKTDHKLMYSLKWTEGRHSIDYKSFRQGEQLVNHIPNINLLTTKIGLLESLRTYYRIQRLVNVPGPACTCVDWLCMFTRPRIPLENFFPQTFRLDSASERDKFILNYKHDGEKFSSNNTIILSHLCDR